MNQHIDGSSSEIITRSMAIFDSFEELLERIMIQFAPTQDAIWRDRFRADLALAHYYAKDVIFRFMLWLLTDPQGVRRHANIAGQKLIDHIAGLYVRLLNGEDVAFDEWRSAAKDAQIVEDGLIDADASQAAYEAIIVAQAATQKDGKHAWMAVHAAAEADAAALEPEGADEPEDLAKADQAYKAAYVRMGQKIAELVSEAAAKLRSE